MHDPGVLSEVRNVLTAVVPQVAAASQGWELDQVHVSARIATEDDIRYAVYPCVRVPQSVALVIRYGMMMQNGHNWCGRRPRGAFEPGCHHTTPCPGDRLASDWGGAR